MGKGKRTRTEKRKKSSEGDNNGQLLKAGRYKSSENSNSSTNSQSKSDSNDNSVIVSEVLNQTNGVLYNVNNLDDSVFEYGSEQPVQQYKQITMASNSNRSQTSNDDLMEYMKRLDAKITNMDIKLQSLDTLEKKVSSFDTELKKIWTQIHDINKKNDERVTCIEEKTETMDFVISQTASKLSMLEKQKENLQNEVTYLQSQSMRNNLLFTNIPEAPSEKYEDTENILRQFMVKEMKVAQDLVDKISFERVHRMGNKTNGRSRNIVAKFTLFKERELVRKQWKALSGTPYFVNEQLPREVIDRRRKLIPRMKEAREQGKTAWLTYDTLYIDGKPVKD